jgi:L-ribulose-5-phosphate 3-epimerase
MRHTFTRRQFLATSAAAAGALALGKAQAAPFATTLKKSLIGSPDEKTLTAWKQAGFDGIEVSRQWDIPLEKAAAAQELAKSLSMEIHSLLFGWANFNKPDAAAKDVADVKKALATTGAYGASALLLVPCRLNAKVAMPQPWDFEIEFDENTSHVTRVVTGDNAQYSDYIAEQNRATDASRRAVEALIPAAEKAGVIIALENVWNNFWVKPKLAANFIASFDSPWVKAYYDIGNHVKYAKPQEWLETLGDLIVKIHVKDFTVDKANARGGSFVDIRDGDVDWPAVRKCIDNIGYNGFMTIEGSGKLSIEERSKRLDAIIAGK